MLEAVIAAHGLPPVCIRCRLPSDQGPLYHTQHLGVKERHGWRDGASLDDRPPWRVVTEKAPPPLPALP